MSNTINHEISLLDFLRGWSAVLVFFHHAAILGGGPNILTGEIGQEAVNAFMFSSGFLIFFQCTMSSVYDGFKSKRGVINFYIRRFFRIAPAYYFALFFAYLFSNSLGDYRQSIATVLPSTATSMNRYYIDNFLINILMHLTFLFGMHPHYSFSTPLPDWSLGLEMQFYFLFPIFFIFFKRNFLLFFSLLLLLMFAFKATLQNVGIGFPMPSFLPLKFHNFAAGISLAYVYVDKNKRGNKFRHWIIQIISIFFLLLGNRTFFTPILALFSYWFLNENILILSILKQYCALLFKHWSSRFLAEISYSVYIMHLLLMIPFYGILHKILTINIFNWIIYAVLLFVFVIIISLFVYKYIELPGINIGKKLIKLSLEKIKESDNLALSRHN